MSKPVLNTALAIIYGAIFMSLLVFSFSFNEFHSFIVLLPLFAYISLMVLTFRYRIQTLEDAVVSLTKKVEDLKKEISKGK